MSGLTILSNSNRNLGLSKILFSIGLKIKLDRPLEIGLNTHLGRKKEKSKKST